MNLPIIQCPSPYQREILLHVIRRVTLHNEQGVLWASTRFPYPRLLDLDGRVWDLHNFHLRICTGGKL